MTAFIDRCKMYVRRCGGDPKEQFVIELLKSKVLESLSSDERKILNATMPSDDDLDEILVRADAVLDAKAENEEIESISKEVDNQGFISNLNLSIQGPLPTNSRSFRGYCGKCRQYGHMRRQCPY